MLNHTLRFKISCISFLLVLCFVHGKAQRQINDFDSGWKFHSGDLANAQQAGYNDVSWRILNLPHDWSIEGKFDEKNPATPGGGALPGGIGWYRKAFNVPAGWQGKSVFIDFDGVYRNSEVWINGRSLGVRPNGYVAFRYDLTPYLNFGGPNTIAVRVDNSKQPNSRWYSGSGIYRSVKLVTTGKVFVDNWGTFITTPEVSASSADIHIETALKNTLKGSQKVLLTTVVYSPEKKEVGRVSKSVYVSEKTIINQTLRLASPLLWSDDRPHLYRAETIVKVNGKITDSYETTFGIRSFRFDPEKGFFLNGRSLKIRGVCNHHDLGALGAAFNERAAERQLQILKAMGCNGIRTAHNAPASALLDLCDRMGFIVMDEAFDIWKKGKNEFDYSKDWDKWHVKDLQDQILRDRNHPSIFMYSVGNEIQEQWGDEAKGDTSGRTIARELVAIVKKLDNTREITSANNEISPGNNLLKSGAFSLVGYNYNHAKYKDVHKLWGADKAFIASETVSSLHTRGSYDMRSDSIRLWPPSWDKPLLTGNADLTCSAYDNCHAPWGSTHEETLKEFNRLSFVSGMYVWTGFDYLGEPTPYPWPARSSYFGIMDMAGFPKDVYYLYQSEWTNKSVLHVFPHWNWKVGQLVDVWAYFNNADEVELFLNGKSLGTKSKGEDMHVMWRVPFEPGTIKAISRKNGATVLVREINTAGKAAKVVIEADRAKIKADGKDLSFITAKIVDSDGNLIPDADHQISFEIAGNAEIAAVDNGLQTSHEPFQASYRKAFNGLALAIVRSTGKTGSISIKATVKGLQGHEIKLSAN